MLLEHPNLKDCFHIYTARRIKNFCPNGINAMTTVCPRCIVFNPELLKCRKGKQRKRVGGYGRKKAGNGHKPKKNFSKY